MTTVNVGIVSPVIKGDWNNETAYDRLNIVHGADGATYEAIQAVPAGTALSNTTYWMQITPKAITLDTAEDVAFDYGADHDDLVTNVGTAMAPKLHFKVPRGVTGNESIDDTAGEGDDDVVWSADKSWKETNNITADRLSIVKTDTSIISAQNILYSKTNAASYTSTGGPKMSESQVPCPGQGTKIKIICNANIIEHPEYYLWLKIRCYEYDTEDATTPLVYPDLEFTNGNAIEYEIQDEHTHYINFAVIWKGNGTNPSSYKEYIKVDYFHAFVSATLNTTYLSLIDDSAGDGDNNVVWSADKVWNEISSMTSKTINNVLAKVPTFSYEGPASTTSTGTYIHDIIKAKPNTDYYFSFDSLTATGTTNALSIRVAEYDENHVLLHRNDATDPGIHSFKSMSNTAELQTWIIYKADSALTYTVTNFQLRQIDLNHDYYLPSDNILIGDDAKMVPLSMFCRIGFVGDSYTAGSIHKNDDEWVGRIEELTWGKVLCREIGAEGTIFATSGLTTKTWLTNENGLTKLLAADPQELYFIALGINDYSKIKDGTYSLGTIADINVEDYTQNEDTFYGNYGKIVSQILIHAPHAKIICIGYLRSSFVGDAMISPAVQAIAELFGIGYIYPKDDRYLVSMDWDTRQISGHPVATGYAGMARAVKRLAERHIYDNYDYYKDYYGDFLNE